MSILASIGRSWLDKDLRSQSMYRLMSSAPAALLAFGASATKRLLLWRHYRRTLKELESLSDRDLQDLKICKADFDAIAWDEAERSQKLKRRSRL
jgi:uncharacterized protein YjiS (DUF1127 family)